MTETKHMTFDELMKVYDKAASNVAFLQYEGPDHCAGIRAVVEALRDEMLPPKRKVSASSTIVRAIILQKFNEILASDEENTDAILAALAEAGLVIVPRVPTPELCFKILAALPSDWEGFMAEHIKQLWRAMVEAANEQ